MYAIVEIAGKQYKVEEKQEIFVDRLDVKEGDKVDFDKVLLVDNKGTISVGAPTVSGAKVSAKVITDMVKDDKVIVFKKKRRKGYRVKNGHRQQFTKVSIEKIKA
ncbi:MAG: 50S ribosomal protein L21 [Cyclobacteriaceae bacterium]